MARKMLTLLVALLAVSFAAEVPRQNPTSMGAVNVGPCEKEQTSFGLVLVENGRSPTMPTKVRICHSDLTVRFTVDVDELSTNPPYTSGMCNDDTNPIFKNNAVELFLGYADDVDHLSEYLEVQANPKGALWLGKIVIDLARNKYGSATSVPCSGSEITVKVDKLPGGTSTRSSFRYQFSVPLRMLPGYGTKKNLYGTVLRIAHTDPTFRGDQKELQAIRSHGRRNFHSPDRFQFFSLSSNAGAPTIIQPVEERQFVRCRDRSGRLMPGQCMLKSGCEGQPIPGLCLGSAGDVMCCDRPFRVRGPREPVGASRFPGRPFLSVKPGDASYDEERLNMNTLAEPIRPQIIHYPQNDQDVAAILASLPRGSQVNVRAGRHSYVVASLGPGVVIDVSEINHIDLSDSPRTVTVGAGVKNFDVQYRLSKLGLVVPLGTCPSVGAGFFLGGGYSLLSKDIGLGADAILSMDVVLADGTLIKGVSTTNRPDLFWALRGAGTGNFAVVTAMKLKLSPMPPKVSLMRFSWENAARALPVWEKFLMANHEDTKLNPQGFFKAKGGARANVFFLGGLEELRQKTRPLSEAGPTASLSEKETTWPEILFQFAGCTNPEKVASNDFANCEVVAHLMPKLHPRAVPEEQHPWVAASAYISRPIGSLWEEVVKELDLRPGTIVIADAMGGRINQVPSTDTAFPHRNTLYHFQIMNYFSKDVTPEQRKEREDRVHSYWQFLNARRIISGAYSNYPSMSMKGEDWRRAYFGDNYDKLVQVKLKYDPSNVFRHDFGIKARE